MAVADIASGALSLLRTYREAPARTDLARGGSTPLRDGGRAPSTPAEIVAALVGALDAPSRHRQPLSTDDCQLMAQLGASARVLCASLPRVAFLEALRAAGRAPNPLPLLAAHALHASGVVFASDWLATLGPDDAARLATVVASLHARGPSAVAACRATLGQLIALALGGLPDRPVAGGGGLGNAQGLQSCALSGSIISESVLAGAAAQAAEALALAKHTLAYLMRADADTDADVDGEVDATAAFTAELAGEVLEFANQALDTHAHAPAAAALRAALASGLLHPDSSRTRSQAGPDGGGLGAPEAFSLDAQLAALTAAGAAAAAEAAAGMTASAGAAEGGDTELVGALEGEAAGRARAYEALLLLLGEAEAAQRLCEAAMAAERREVHWGHFFGLVRAMVAAGGPRRSMLRQGVLFELPRALREAAAPSLLTMAAVVWTGRLSEGLAAAARSEDTPRRDRTPRRAEPPHREV
ncbi:hypothetical protein T492DRAFT_166220 [Pavlovales sp. CCMP2436]|nr:hypothetical protein T492DRAFT_166220 [Pavlovales sp. CCMP2436]